MVSSIQDTITPQLSKKMKTFEHWTRQDIADKFGLDVKSECEDLAAWLNVDGDTNYELSATEEQELNRLQLKLRENVDTWNEQELIIKFIGMFHSQ